MRIVSRIHRTRLKMASIIGIISCMFSLPFLLYLSRMIHCHGIWRSRKRKRMRVTDIRSRDEKRGWANEKEEQWTRNMFSIVRCVCEIYLKIIYCYLQTRSHLFKTSPYSVPIRTALTLLLENLGALPPLLQVGEGGSFFALEFSLPNALHIFFYARNKQISLLYFSPYPGLYFNLHLVSPHSFPANLVKRLGGG